MSLDLVLRNGRVANGAPADAPVDIGIKDGRIAAIEPNLGDDGPAIDLDGSLVTPGLIESHFHLDKALIVDRCPPPADRRSRDHMARTASIKHTFTVEDIYTRARDTLEQCVLNGVTHMRTHVEVDPNVGLRGFEAIQQLAEDYRWAIDLQLCAFLQEGWTDKPGADENLVEALKRGATVVGGAPRYDSDGEAQIRRVFELARDFDVDVDFHLDGGHTTDLDMHLVCDLADEMGWGGRVSIGHGSKYSCLPLDELAAVGRRLADSGVAVAVLPATDLFNNGRHQDYNIIRGVADAHALISHGANCSISTNNVMNPFTPYGDCSLTRIANLYMNIVQRSTETELTDCFDMLTHRPARALRLSGYGVAAGNPADLAVWNVPTVPEVVATIAQPSLGFKGGRQTFTRTAAELHRT
ncbi:MAG: amidohydrolase family protein [Alphaproteobacteria bacterium]|nr:amidohydrolase family protein [Alphaproteobacteria bacterium]